MKKSVFKTAFCWLIALCLFSGCSLNIFSDSSESSLGDSSYSDSSGSQLCEHTYTWETVLAPICGRDGFKDGTCSKCGDVVTEHIDALTHSYKNGVCEHCNKPDPSFTPAPSEEDDLATGGHVASLAPENYGTNNTLTVQSDVVASNESTAALKGVFNKEGADVYQGYMIWTWAEFRIGDHFGKAQDVRNKSFIFDVKKENCGPRSSIILVSENGNRTLEYAFSTNAPAESNPIISCESRGNGWYRISIHLSALFMQNDILKTTSEMLIMFSNVDCNPEKDSVFYIDNAKLIDASQEPTGNDVTVYNPDGYYSKSETLNIKIVGNSFVFPYYSNSAYYLEQFCNALDASVNVSYLSIGNGRIPDQYNLAFGYNGYIQNEQIDVLFIQDFYDLNDAIKLGDFLRQLYAVSPQTELKIYAGENETEDGLRASLLYGVDHVDWRGAIKTLKSSHGFTATNLNDAYDGWHPNAVSGFVGGLMMCMELYGERPDLDAVTAIAEKEIWHLLPGTSDSQKATSVWTLYDIARSFVGV